MEGVISCRLREMGNGDTPRFQGDIKSLDDSIPSSNESSPKIRSSHCSFCGHPGSKRAHFKFSCEYCSTSKSEGCMKKPEGFKCDCASCDKVCPFFFFFFCIGMSLLISISLLIFLKSS
jgi:flap endonuclease GEN